MATAMAVLGLFSVQRHAVKKVHFIGSSAGWERLGAAALHLHGDLGSQFNY